MAEDTATKLANLKELQDVLLFEQPDHLEANITDILDFRLDLDAKVRKFVLSFITLACEKNPAVAALPCLNVLPSFFSDRNSLVQRQALLTMCFIYKSLFGWLCTVQVLQAEPIWIMLSEISDKLCNLNPRDLSEAVRLTLFKFCQRIIMIHTPYPPEQSRVSGGGGACNNHDNSVNVRKVPPGHPFLAPSALITKADKYFQKLLKCVINPPSGSSLMVLCGVLLASARARPDYYMDRVCDTIIRLCSAFPSFSPYQIASLKKQLKVQFQALLEMPEADEFKSRIKAVEFMARQDRNRGHRRPEMKRIDRDRELERQHQQQHQQREREKMDRERESRRNRDREEGFGKRTRQDSESAIGFDSKRGKWVSDLQERNNRIFERLARFPIPALIDLVAQTLPLLPDTMPEHYVDYALSSRCLNQISSDNLLSLPPPSPATLQRERERQEQIERMEKEERENLERKLREKQDILDKEQKEEAERLRLTEEKEKEEREALALKRATFTFKPLPLTNKDKLSSFLRILDSEKKVGQGGGRRLRIATIAKLVCRQYTFNSLNSNPESENEFTDILQKYVLKDIKKQQDLAFVWLYEEYAALIHARSFENKRMTARCAGYGAVFSKPGSGNVALTSSSANTDIKSTGDTGNEETSTIDEEDTVVVDVKSEIKTEDSSNAEKGNLDNIDDTTTITKAIATPTGIKSEEAALVVQESEAGTEMEVDEEIDTKEKPKEEDAKIEIKIEPGTTEGSANQAYDAQEMEVDERDATDAHVDNKNKIVDNDNNNNNNTMEVDDREIATEENGVEGSLSEDTKFLQRYYNCYDPIVMGIKDIQNNEKRERLFKRFLLDVPETSPQAITIIEEFCDDVYRAKFGLDSLLDLITYRPRFREQSFDILLSLSLVETDSIRKQAIEACAKLYTQRDIYQEKIQAFALKSLQQLLEDPPMDSPAVMEVIEARYEKLEQDKLKQEKEMLEKEIIEKEKLKDAEESAPPPPPPLDSSRPPSRQSLDPVSSAPASSPSSPTSTTNTIAVTTETTTTTTATVTQEPSKNNQAPETDMKATETAPLVDDAEANIDVVTEWPIQALRAYSSLFFELCLINPSLLKSLADIYSKGKRDLQFNLLRCAAPMIKQLDPNCEDIIDIVKHFPDKSAPLVRFILETVTAKEPPSDELINTIKELVAKKDYPADFLIPVISRLSKADIISALPRLISLQNKAVEKWMLYTLEGRYAGMPPPISPQDFLFALHDLPTSSKAFSERLKFAHNNCFEKKRVYTQEVLANVIQQLVDRSTLPNLLMPTIVKSASVYPALSQFVISTLQRLVGKSIWQYGVLWKNFVRTCFRLSSKGYNIILGIPPSQLESVLKMHSSYRQILQDHVASSKVRISDDTRRILGEKSKRSRLDKSSKSESEKSQPKEKSQH